MQPLLDKQAQTWLWAFALGSAITVGLFYSLNQLGRISSPPAPTVIRVSLSQWLPPAPLQTQQAPPPPKSAPKPQPRPEPEPVIKTPAKPEPKPVLKEAPVSEPVPPPLPEPEPLTPTEPVSEQAPEPFEVIEEKETAPIATPVFELSRMPSFVHKAMPSYPSLERRIGNEGDVILEVFIDSRGEVGTISVKQSAGAAFDQAAIEAIKSSRFSPGEVDGAAVAVIMTLPVRFRLR